MTRKYHYEFDWENDTNTNICIGQFCHAEFNKECVSEFEAASYAIDWMRSQGIDSSNLMYCRVEEVFDSEMRTNVLLWIGE